MKSAHEYHKHSSGYMFEICRVFKVFLIMLNVAYRACVCTLGARHRHLYTCVGVYMNKCRSV